MSSGTPTLAKMLAPPESHGRTAVGRGGASILANVGVPELIAQTPEQYVQITNDLANDLPRLGELRRTLRGRMQASPLMDAPRFSPVILKRRTARCGGIGVRGTGDQNDSSAATPIRPVASSGRPIGRGGEDLPTDPGTATGAPVALHFLGVIARQTGRNDLAVDLIRRAIAINPNYAEAHSNLGVALKSNGQLDEAIAAYRLPLSSSPICPKLTTISAML